MISASWIRSRRAAWCSTPGGWKSMIEELERQAAAKPAPALVPTAVPRPHRKMAPIVPLQNVAGRSLISVIAIMTFLSCLTFGAVSLVSDSASIWESQIAREATIQIKPADGLDMEEALDIAARVAGGFAGVQEARIVD